MARGWHGNSKAHAKAGKLGGLAGKGTRRGFAANRERAAEAGRKGGSKSKRIVARPLPDDIADTLVKLLGLTTSTT